MSSRDGSGVKRDVETAFGGETSHNPKYKSHRQSGIAREKQRQSQKGSKSYKPKDQTSKRKDGPPVALQPTEQGLSKGTSAFRKARVHRNSASRRLNRQALTRDTIKQRAIKKSEWRLSGVNGGRFIDHDPLLVEDDKYLILAVRTEMHVYSTELSLLVRSMRIKNDDHITSFTRSQLNPHHLYVSTHSGTILKWDWKSGQKLKQWKSKANLLSISDHHQDEVDNHPSVLLIHEGSENSRKLSSSYLIETSETISEGNVILEYQSTSSWVKFFRQARCLVLYTADRLILGHAPATSAATQSRYTWREIAVPQIITSVDAKSRRIDPRMEEAGWAVDIVLGCDNGAILIYDDIISHLRRRERNPREDEILSRRFHWHRNEVLALKWSLDGNYIISGGRETVMVIWQLDTGEQQFLPHLSAAIQSITISQTGSSYAMRLADNSVAVLSTSELQPTAYIGGIALEKRQRNKKAPKKVPVAFEGANSALLTMAVPADHQVKSITNLNATLLQTYDIKQNRHIARQALVRNNITALNVDPSGKPIQEPDVTHLQISHNGRWLVTVDEWTQPSQDSEGLYPQATSPRSQMKEVFLKFWSKNSSTRSWELVTKIENPHPAAEEISASILDLKANPRRTEFSTVSSSGSVHIWTPKRRHRDGLPITDSSGSSLHTWTSTHSIEVQTFSGNVDSSMPPIKSALAYSRDGSVLATASNTTLFVTFLDPRAGTVKHSQRGSYPEAFAELSFLGHHLITVSKDLRVHNVVSGELLWALALDPSVRDVFLAVDEADRTFALAFVLSKYAGRKRDGEGRGQSPRIKSQIMVFHLDKVQPIHTAMINSRVETLLPLNGETGYLIIDGEAEVMKLHRPGTGTSVQNLGHGASLAEEEKLESTMAPLLTLESLKLDRLVIGDVSANAVDAQRLKQEETQTPTLQSTYKTHNSLADVFEQSDTINRPVRTLFDNVVAALRGEQPEQ